LFEGADKTTLILGSNNLTDGGFYTNYEAAVRYDFELPADAEEFHQMVDPLLPFIQPAGAAVQRLTAERINTLVARGMLPTEAEARRNRRDQAERQQRPPEQAPANPFLAVAVPNPPLLPQGMRAQEPTIGPVQPAEQPAEQAPAPRPEGGLLVWRKTLPRTDALQVNEGSHHVGGGGVG
jgi:hypothetical protein